MKASAGLRIGIDLGDSKIEIAAFDSVERMLVRRRVASPSHDYEAVIEAIALLVLQVETETGSRGSVGVGTPGSPSRKTGLIKNANSTVLIGRALEADLARRLERDIRIANDADCFTLSEARDGAGAGEHCVFGVILGTGVGGGIAVDGKLLAGPNGIAGEWGHNPLPWPRPGERPGPLCYCGKHGCNETFLSGPALTRDAAAHGAPADGVPALVAAAETGEPAARAALERYADRLARALAAVVNVLDPGTIVLGGGVSNVPQLCGELSRRLPAYVFSDSVETSIRRAIHGDSSGVRGAAWLWP
jgi:fructokinase